MNETIHEGVIADIVRFISDDLSGKDLSLPKTIQGGDRYMSNIMRTSSDLILTFPVIVDSSVSVESATSIAKSLERKMVSVLSILLSAVNINNNADAFEFIGKIHKNLSSDDVIGFINRMESKPFRENMENDGFDIDGINESFIAHSLQESKRKTRKQKNHSGINGGYRKNKNPVSDLLNKTPSVYSTGGDIKGGGLTNMQPSNIGIGSNSKNKSSDQKTDSESKDKRSSSSSRSYNGNNDFVVTSIPTEYKKYGELPPSLLLINFRTGDNNETQAKALIGVKAKLIMVSQDDMIERIITKQSDNNVVFDILRSTTGEMSMFKDFVFAINRAKMDIFSTSRNSSPIWKLLERRAILGKANKYLSSSNGNGSAIATLVISSTTEDVLKRDYNFQCRPYTIMNIMKEYSTMGFAIADDIRERVRILFDDNSLQYETLQYSELEKEEKNQFKKLINLMITSR